LTGTAFSPDGCHVLTFSQEDRTASVWSVVNGRRRALFHDLDFFPIFSPDSRHVLTVSGGLVRVWDTAERQRGLPLRDSGAAREGHLLPALTDEPEIRLLGNGESQLGAFSPNGRRVLLAFENEARVWNASTGEPVTPPLRHDSSVFHVAFSPDGLR